MNSYRVDQSSSSQIIEENQNISSSNNGNTQVDMTNSLRNDPILKHLLLDGRSSSSFNFGHYQMDVTNSLRDDPILKHLLIDIPSRQHQDGLFTPWSYQRELEIQSGTGSEYGFNTPTNDFSITSWGSETNESPEQWVPRPLPTSLLELSQRISQRYQNGVFEIRPSSRFQGSFEGEEDHVSRTETRSSSLESEFDQDVIRIYPIEVEESPVLEIHVE